MQLYNKSNSKLNIYKQGRKKLKKQLFRKILLILIIISFLLSYISNTTTFAAKDDFYEQAILCKENTISNVSQTEESSNNESITDIDRPLQSSEEENLTENIQTEATASLEEMVEQSTIEKTTETKTETKTVTEVVTEATTGIKEEKTTEILPSEETFSTNSKIIPQQEKMNIKYDTENVKVPLGYITAAREWADGHYLWYINTGSLTRHYVFCLEKGKVMKSGIFKPSIYSGTFGTSQNTFRIALAMDYFKSKGGWGNESGYEDAQYAIWNEGITKDSAALITYSNYLWKLTECNPNRAAGSGSFSSSITAIKETEGNTKAGREKVSVNIKKIKAKNSDSSYDINNTISLSGSAWKYFAKGGSGFWNTSAPGSHGKISVLGCFASDGSQLAGDIAKASVREDGSLTVHINQKDSVGKEIATTKENAVMVVMQVNHDYAGASSIQYLESGSTAQRLSYNAEFSSPAYFAVKFYAEQTSLEENPSITINKVDEFGKEVEGAQFNVIGYNRNGDILTGFPVMLTAYNNNLMITEEGEYQIVETKAPYGMEAINTVANIRARRITGETVDKLYIEQIYVSDGIETITTDNGYSYTYTVPNKYLSGSAYLKKAGNVFVDYKNGEFIYKERNLSNVKFELHAAEDIYAGSTLIFSNDQVITQEILDASIWNTIGKHNANISEASDAVGDVFYNNLPPGNYYIVESSNPYSGYGVYGTRLEFTIKPDQTIPIHDGIYYNNPVCSNCLVEKIDAEDENKKLAGAEFTLYAHIRNTNFDGYQLFSIEDTVPAVISRKNGKERMLTNTWIPIDTVTTNEDGQAMFDVKMPYGKYLVVETHAPEGYTLAEESYEFTHTYDPEKTYASGVLFTHTFKDERKSNLIRIQKYGDVLSGAETVITEYGSYQKLQYETLPVKDVTFEIYDATDTLVETLKTDKGGTATSNNLPPGMYTIREVENGGFLKLDSITKKVEFKENEITAVQTKTVEFMNDSLSTKFHIYKEAEIANLVQLPEGGSETDALYSYNLQPISDVVFAIFTKEDIKNYNDITVVKAGSCIGYCVTDKNGIATFDETLCNGSYYYKEIKTADDTYIKDTQNYSFDVKLNGNNIEKNLNDNSPVTNKKYKGSIKVIKTDDTGDIALKDVKFILYDANKKVIGTFLTDINGGIHITNLPIGTYYLQETETLHDYELDDTMYEINLTSSELDQVLNMKNKKEDNKITVHTHTNIPGQKNKKITEHKKIQTGDSIIIRIVTVLLLIALFSILLIQIIKKGEKRGLLKSKNKLWMLLFILLCTVSLPGKISQAATVVGEASVKDDTIYVTYDDCTYQYVDCQSTYNDKSYFVLVDCKKENNTHILPDNISFSCTYVTQTISNKEEYVTISKTAPVFSIKLNQYFYGTLVIPESSNIKFIDFTNLSYIPTEGMYIMVYKKEGLDFYFGKEQRGLENCFTVYYKSYIAKDLLDYMARVYGNDADIQKIHYFKAKVNYVLNGGINNPSNLTEYIIYDGFELKEPTRKNYRFAGWYTTESFDGNTRLNSISDKLESDITVYARWEYDAKVTRAGINYQINGDKQVSVLPGDYQGDIIIANDISYNGYSYPVTAISKDAFSGNNITSVIIPENITVIEEGAFRDCSDLSDIYINSMTLPLGDNFSKSVNLHTYADSQAYLDYLEDGYIGKLTVYSSRIHYVLNGGINGDNPDIYTWKSLLVFAEPQKDNCKFAGWYTDAAFQPSSIIKSIYEDVYQDIVVYAKWITLISNTDSEEEIAAPREADLMETNVVKQEIIEKQIVSDAPTATWQIAGIDSVSAKNVKNRKIKLNIRAENADGFQIKYSNTKNFSKGKTFTINTKKNSYTIKKLKLGKTYYIKARGYNFDKKGIRVYSSWSSVKKVKIKK